MPPQLLNPPHPCCHAIHTPKAVDARQGPVLSSFFFALQCTSRRMLGRKNHTRARTSSIRFPGYIVSSAEFKTLLTSIHRFTLRHGRHERTAPNRDLRRHPIRRRGGLAGVEPHDEPSSGSNRFPCERQPDGNEPVRSSPVAVFPLRERRGGTLLENSTPEARPNSPSLGFSLVRSVRWKLAPAPGWEGGIVLIAMVVFLQEAQG